ncbi:MAG: enoyl-CoA hydratase/isomerase family protein [Microscillaceae bacterium]|jgi:enoyl-CoA hydratase/carnithine racemase|nr:enoyl-CoA hydratase/isomerase family protein [Microscillaceae bacterium]
MNYENIIYTAQDGVARIRLNRPSVMNALSPQLVAELLAAVRQVAADDSVKVMVVSGEGRAWSAGVDLQALNASIQGGQFSADQILIDGVEFINMMQTMPKVTIAQVNGFCFTGALEFMLAFDLIYAAEEAKIGDTHAKWGIAPKWGMTQRLPQMVGILKAREMSFTAQAITGKEAEKIGLVNRAVPLENLENTVNQVVEHILGNSAQGIAAMKELYYKGMNTTLREGLAIEYQSHYIINDRQEFLQGFKENKSK